MRTIQFTSCIPLLLLGGCFLIPAEEEEDDTRSGFHDVTINWRLKNLDDSVMTSCPPGFTTLFTHLYKSGYVEPPDALVATPCTPQGSITEPVATAGKLIDEETRELDLHAYYDYSPRKDIWIDVSEETQSAYAATSFMYHFDDLSSDTTIEFDLYPEGGVGVLAWSLSSSLTSAPLTSCATAGVDTIEVAYRPWFEDTAPLVVIGSWPCGERDPYFYYDPDGNSTLFDSSSSEDYKLGSGHSKAVAPGEYFVELRAKRAGAVVGTAMSSLRSEDKNAAHRFSDSDIPINDR